MIRRQRQRQVRNGPDGPKRRRASQETIDDMAALRRRGLTFQEIGARVGCSERTARRYAGKVLPQLHVPGTTPQLDTDPRKQREQLVTQFMQCLHDDKRLQSLTRVWKQVDADTILYVYGGPPSILFLSEAGRLLRERLESLGMIALRMLAENRQSQRRFVREVVGNLYWDYVTWHQFRDNFDPEGAKEDWRPSGERPPIPDFDPGEVENPFGFPTA